MNDTIFIHSTQQIYVQNFMSKLLTIGELELVRRGRRRRRRKEEERS
jgi:hypothetical protein